MNNKIKQEISKIEIPKELSERSKMGIFQAKKEMNRSRKRNYYFGILASAGLLISIGVTALLNNDSTPNNAANNPTPSVTKDGGVKIPAIQLPKDTSNAKMIGLIVYNGKIYTNASTVINGEDAKALLGEKLGTTKGTIDEWSKQEAYAEEFASTTGIADVYTVKGYDKNFRIMTYFEQEGTIYAEFYENLNGITVQSGADVFGKVKIAGNISAAQYRIFSDWDNSIENYHPITDMAIVNTFVEELNSTKPLPRQENSDPIGDYRDDENYRELILNLNDGTRVRLTLLKDGYIYYGFMGVYFKMNDEVFSKMWNLLE